MVLALSQTNDRNKYRDRKVDIISMGAISKKGRLFLGKNGNRLPKNARRSRKPLQKDWVTGKRPPSLKSAGKTARDRLRPRRQNIVK
jgi:hypothetical protein